MSSFAERSRENVINQLQNDPRLDGDTVLAVAPLMRASVLMLVTSGMVGVIVVQSVIGFGGFQFAIGLFAGYAAYVGYVLATAGKPRIIGAMAVLTDKRVVLLGSRRVGIVGEWNLRDLEDIELLRKGNILIMGKIAIVPKEGERMGFFMSNRGMGLHFIEQYQNLSR